MAPFLFHGCLCKREHHEVLHNKVMSTDSAPRI